MPEISKDTVLLEDSAAQRTVLLEGRYRQYNVRQKLAQFFEDGVYLIHFTEEDKPESFNLTTENMQALVAAYQQWQAAQQAAAEAEQARQESIILAAKLIVQENPGIVLDEQGQSWRVSVPDAGWKPTYPTSEPDHLLELVKEAQRILLDFQKRFAEQQEALNKALELAKTIPGINLNEKEHPHTFFKKIWHVRVISPIGNLIYCPEANAFNGEDLYKQVKAAYVAYSNVVDDVPVDEIEKKQPTTTLNSLDHLDGHPF